MSPDPDPIETAARWLADNWLVAPTPFTKTLREKFGLQFLDAVKAMTKARDMMSEVR